MGMLDTQGLRMHGLCATFGLGSCGIDWCRLRGEQWMGMGGICLGFFFRQRACGLKESRRIPGMAFSTTLLLLQCCFAMLLRILIIYRTDIFFMRMGFVSYLGFAATYMALAWESYFV
ncbi:hypothetical protein EDB81DRAFT_772676 [Dactylonectria macrodidyma]|uniref:Uncharacterized protein n=1 Tax=Dactylonectria macrodidyma TaxID=307937 RepID=A0A9P9JJA4_9HYPO|nr:hypothetical protein EDB81DRAFT_772676 [Dactylonectria macrodidyma]